MICSIGLDEMQQVGKSNLLATLAAQLSGGQGASADVLATLQALLKSHQQQQQQQQPQLPPQQQLQAQQLVAALSQQQPPSQAGGGAPGGPATLNQLVQALGGGTPGSLNNLMASNPQLAQSTGAPGSGAAGGSSAAFLHKLLAQQQQRLPSPAPSAGMLPGMMPPAPVGPGNLSNQMTNANSHQQFQQVILQHPFVQVPVLRATYYTRMHSYTRTRTVHMYSSQTHATYFTYIFTVFV